MSRMAEFGHVYSGCSSVHTKAALLAVQMSCYFYPWCKTCTFLCGSACGCPTAMQWEGLLSGVQNHPFGSSSFATEVDYRIWRTNFQEPFEL